MASASNSTLNSGCHHSEMWVHALSIWEIKQGVCSRRFYNHASACGHSSAVHSFRCFRCVAYCGVVRMLTSLCKPSELMVGSLDKLRNIFDCVVLLGRFLAFHGPEDAHQRKCFSWKPFKKHIIKDTPAPVVPDESDDELFLQAAAAFAGSCTPSKTEQSTAVQQSSKLDDSDDEDLLMAASIYTQAKRW